MTSAPTPKAFSIHSSSDLLQKLEWEIEQSKLIDDETISGYHFWNCAVTAWHVLDWLFDERKPVTIDGKEFTELHVFQGHVREQRSDALKQCYQYRNGGKHGPAFHKADPKTFTDYLNRAFLRDEHRADSSA